jgi:hypothetical protein
MELENCAFSQIQVFRSNEFMLLCNFSFVGLIIYGGEIFPSKYGEDLVQWPALIGDRSHRSLPKSIAHGFPSF